MNPSLALILCLVFVGYCLRRDLKNTPREGSVWLLSLFLINIGARPPSMWLNPYAGEKSLLDNTINVAFIIAGLTVYMRHPERERAKVSGAVLVFLGYCALSLLWSDGGLEAARKYVKMLGMLVMALVMATESNPLAALTKVFRRAGYILIPFSFLFIKYFVRLGVRYDEWTGQPMYIGVTAHKNLLGQLCLLITLILLSSLMTRVRERVSAQERWEMRFDTGLVVLAAYLLWRYADSATSLVCLLVGSATFFLLGLPSVRNYVGSWLLTATFAVAVGQGLFGLSAVVAEALGRDASMTNRTLIWEELFKHVVNPWIGAGYEGFWSDPVRRTTISESFSIGSAHNGYLEIYLNLGIIGLLLFVGVLLSMYRRCRDALQSGSDFGRTSLAIWIAIVLHNTTEAGWRGLSVILFLSLVLALQRTSPAARVILTQPAPGTLRSHALRGA